MKKLLVLVFLCFAGFHFIKVKSVPEKAIKQLKVEMPSLINEVSVHKIDATGEEEVGEPSQIIDDTEEVADELNSIEEKLKAFNFPHSTNNQLLTDSEKKEVIELLVRRERLEQIKFQRLIKQRERM